MKGQLSPARSALVSASRRSKSKNELANIYLLIGIIDYTSGNKSAAQKAFSLSKGFNPSLVINPNEVLDTSVISFYKSIPVPRKANRNVGRSSRKTPSPKNVVPQKKGTFMFIASKTKDASVLIDGIIVGTVNSPIEVSPGTQTVEITKPGHFTRKISLNMRSGTTTQQQIDLKRKPTQAEIAAAKAKARAKKRAKIARKREAARAAEAKERAAEQRRRAALERKRRKQNRGGLFKEKEPVYTAPPAAQPGYAQPYAPPQPAYQQPGYSAPYPQQPYGAYPGYQQPAPPPPVYSPPAYNPGYAQPVPPPAVVDPYIMEPQTFDDIESSKRRKKKRRKRRKKASEVNYVTAWMPFGIAQYAHDRPLLGTLFLAGQAGALTFWYISYEEKNTTVATATESVKALEKEIENTSGVEADAKRAELEDFDKRTKEYLATQDQNMLIGQIGFGVLWAASIAEAMIRGPYVERDDWVYESELRNGPNSKSPLIVDKNYMEQIFNEKTYETHSSYRFGPFISNKQLAPAIVFESSF